MKICILEADRPAETHRPRFGTYAGMFETWLGAALPEAGFTRVYVAGGAALPADPAAFDAYLVTGARAGAYEDHPWIPPLEAFLRAAGALRVPLLGVCFGHQIIAQALGGRVEKSAEGWQIGRQEHRLTTEGTALFGGETLAALSAHQDQVTVLPPGARRLLANAASPNGGLGYETVPALTVQFHPEFDPAYLRALLDEPSGLRLPEERAALARAGLSEPLDGGRVAKGFANFLRAHTLTRS
ncbi:type 1 glutamine amidotransferase [Salipiger sp. P9]|uniref:type 1 glutamine amidotransferase n=1 Tax=Salipiger pentaromativorans TaxID=2943193 RepID=UPI0021585642|nr:type 1 glutamine amidotransferase [Salipiger pentaromativorans]MCR8546900.1 type 1 glutamine amidotransferase [Salipiger pentaromativorans]